MAKPFSGMFLAAANVLSGLLLYLVGAVRESSPAPAASWSSLLGAVRGSSPAPAACSSFLTGAVRGSSQAPAACWSSYRLGKVHESFPALTARWSPLVSV
eukprot:gene4595-biopygen7476